MTKYLNLDLDKTLGGQNPSDYTISSQKAIKSYVDAATDLDLNSLKDVTISSPETGQLLRYVDGQWVNAAGDAVEVNWGDIKGQLAKQLDLKEAFDKKHNLLTAGDGIEINNETNTISTLAFVINDYTQEA